MVHRESLRNPTRDYYGSARQTPAVASLVMDMRLIDGVLPAHDARLVRGTVVRAPSDVVYQTALGVDMIRLWKGDVVTRLLIAGRTLPDTAARLLPRQAARPQAPASGSLRDLPDRGLWVRLAEQPGREFVFGAVGRFWGDAV